MFSLANLLKTKQIIALAALALSLCFSQANAFDTESFDDLTYLPDGQNYDPAIPKPISVLGYPVGTWHVRHDQVINYMKALAAASDRISLQVTGYTHEQRPLVLLTITSASNQASVEQMRSEHIARLSKGEPANAEDPLFIYMGYSVHGNEPSGTNAALLVAYHLAASRSEEVETLLSENVVLLDPSLNPDGLSRFAQWANMHKGYNIVANPMHREHREHWPSGRTNHYWFDLNRDWLLLTHPESQARIKQFHHWRPHILTDFHEMGTNSTYFFQPGIASRKNPWTPDTNVTLTGALAKFHAAALDNDKELYFTEESFDDFYYGKGSTYPDAHGSIGILFEQASSRGHAQESINGLLEFPRTIHNQVLTSLSTFEGAMATKSAIAAYQSQFYKDTQKLIEDDDFHGFVIEAGKDTARFERALNILSAHQIQWSLLSDELELDDERFAAGSSAYIPLDQAQYRLIRSLFSERTSFVDNTFYDVSNWNIAKAFNLKYAGVEQSSRRKVKTSNSDFSAQAQIQISPEAYAYLFEWHSANAPAMLQALLEQKVQVRVAGQGFTSPIANGDSNKLKEFAPGSIMIPLALNQPDALRDIIEREAKRYKVDVHSVNTGLTPSGIDYGSRRFAPVNAPEVLLVGGKGTSQYDVGEIWHYLDTRVGIAATLVDLSDLGNIELDRYSHIVFASGRYNTVSKATSDNIEAWVKDGGTLIGQKTAISWFAKQGWIENQVLSSETVDKSFPLDGLKYKDRESVQGKKRIAGSVFNTDIDLSHPLFFGYERERLPMFKTSSLVLKSSDDPFTQVASYTDSPLAAGYASDEMNDLVADTAAVVVNPVGRGTVIAFVDNIHFRGYWDGTNKLMSNAIYLSPLM